MKGVTSMKGATAARKPNPERMVPIKEAGQYGRWSNTTLYKLIRKGKITAYKDGRSTLIDLDEVDRYKQSLPTIPVLSCAA